MIFRDQGKLERMLEMRRAGWTYVSLGYIYGVDHSSIYSWCKMRGIPSPSAPISLDIGAIIAMVGIAPKPRQKTYRDYLEEDRRRRLPKLYGPSGALR